MPTKAATRVHLIFNAHIDPVWLWPWDSGLDAGLATFRSACDRLDEYPELTFCNGDAWLLCQVGRCDPELFVRIKAQVASGRWSLYGGWWVQPDCNLPTRAGFERQISLGREYLEGSFGKFTDVARNVDSFGHSAALPEIMAAAGQPNYIMMRPGQNEMKLPARIFRWRGFEGSPEVLAFRVAGTYGFGSAEEGGLAAHVLNAATSLPEGVADTMCFLGVGDHGGGPTKALVESCLRLRDAIPGVKLEFSTPERFFAALRASKAAKFPEVVGELQHHAIGCYPLQRSLKLKLKRAEHLLEALRPSHGAERLKEAWRSVCFNQFHDITGGTCLPSAHVQADAQAGAALAFAEDELKLELRRKYPALPPDEAQRIVLWNPSDTPFEGHVEFSPWLTEPWTRDSALVDAAGRAVPCQCVPAECPSSLRLLFGAKLQAGGLSCLKLKLAPKRPAVFKSPWRELSASRAVNALGFGLSLGAADSVRCGGAELPAPRPQLLEDPSDTWTHNFDRYFEGPAESPRWNDPFLLHSGPVAAALSRTGTLDGQELRADHLVHADAAFHELSLRVNWLSKLKILKLVLPFKARAVRRLDGTAAGRGLARELDGAERPLCDWMLFELEDGSKVGVVCPDILAADANEFRLRLTLLRSPVMANHFPALPAAVNAVHSDHGVQTFRVGFDHSPDVSEASLAARALAWLRPPFCGDLTKGMPPRPG